MINRISFLFLQAVNVIKTYPWVLFSGFLASIFAILASEFPEYHYENSLLVRNSFVSGLPFMKLTLIAILDISLFFALSMTQQVKKWKLLSIIGVVLTIVYYFLFPTNLKSWTSFDITTYVILFLIHHLMVSFLPFLLDKKDELAFWSYNKSLFSNFAKTLLFTGVMTVGLLLAIFAVENLFNLSHYFDKLYVYVSFISGIFGSVFIFLIFANEGINALISDKQVPTVQRFFVQYILIPLLLIYAAILYVYIANIVVTWTLPKGWVSYLVIIYAVFGMISIVLIYPLFSSVEKVWVKMFDRTFYYSLFPLLILLFIAIFTRIIAYGITPNRYFVLILAIWITGTSLYFSFVSKTSLKTIPISLCILAIISIAVPFINAFHVSINSQKNRLFNVLEAANVLEDGVIDTEKPIKRSDIRQIADIVEFLGRNNELLYLKSFLKEPNPTDFEDHRYFGQWVFTGYFSNILEDVKTDTERYEIVISQANAEKQSFLDVSQVDFVYQSEMHYLGKDVDLGGFFLGIEQNHWDKKIPKKMIFSLQSKEGKFVDSHNIIEFLRKKFEKHQEIQLEEKLPEAEMTYSFTLGEFDFKILFNEIRFTKNFNGTEESQLWDFENVNFYCRYVIMVKYSDKN